MPTDTCLSSLYHEQHFHKALCLADSLFLSEHPCQREGITRAGGSTRKKKKLNELRAFVETKLRSCSEKALEKIGHEDSSRRSSISEDQVGTKGLFLLSALCILLYW